MDGLRKVAKKPEDDLDEWGLDLDSKPTRSGVGGGLLGRKPKRADEDDLDNFLDVLEAKRGIESSKPEEKPPPQRPKTAAVKKSPWGEPELDDLDEGASKATDNASQRGAAEQALAAKKRALFGLGQGGGAPADAQSRGSTAPRNRSQNPARPTNTQLSDAND